MKKPFFALKGKLLSCALPVAMLACAVYICCTAASETATGGSQPILSLFDIISRLLR